MSKRIMALAAGLALLLAGTDASPGGKKWDDVWQSPMVVDYDHGDMGGVDLECEALPVPGCGHGELEFDCELDYRCEIAYAAKRVLVYPGGYQVKGDSVVEKTLDLSKEAFDDLGNRIVVKRKGSEYFVEILEGKKATLEISGFETCGSGGEGGVSWTFVGVARTPGASGYYMGGVSVAGAEPEKGVLMDALETPVACTLRQEFLE